MGKVNVGDPLPPLRLQDQRGNWFETESLKGKKNLVLFFYPKDHTAGCTAEVCSFRDEYTSFTDSETEVVGVSADDTRSHQSFITKNRLPFPLLSDPDRMARKTLGVPRSLGFIDGRVTYVIDKQGIVRHIFNALIQTDKHIREALAAIRSINQA